MNWLFKADTRGMHKATLAVTGKDCINGAPKALNVNFAEETASQTGKRGCHRNSHEKYFV